MIFKQFLKRIVPIFFQDLYSSIRYGRTRSRFCGKSQEEIFTSIYHDNYWRSKESRSGPGSTLSATSGLVEQINQLIVDLGIKSILDLSCGDFNWMQRVNLKNVVYTGADIVSDLIDVNTKKYATSSIKFVKADLLVDNIPRCDLIIVRDCLVHFSYDKIKIALNNIIRSGSEYMLSTTFTKTRINRDIMTGDWRPLNLQKPPFRLPPPLLTLEERQAKGFAKEDRGKTLALWKISDLSLFA